MIREEIGSSDEEETFDEGEANEEEKKGSEGEAVAGSPDSAVDAVVDQSNPS